VSFFRVAGEMRIELCRALAVRMINIGNRGYMNLTSLCLIKEYTITVAIVATENCILVAREGERAFNGFGRGVEESDFFC